jgi:peptidoglycan/LPS O-acetylase OafA/YrhL
VNRWQIRLFKLGSKLRQVRYRPEIDGLRALAVTAVIGFHAGLVGFSGGFLGVDIFFVLSGFLITTLLAQEYDDQTFSLKRFYERRIRRLIPALAATLLVSSIAAYFILFPSDLQDFGSSLVSTLLFGSNIYFWQSTDYFATDSDLLPLLHTWTLAVEEQFYLLFPLVFGLLHKHTRGATIWILGLGAIASFGLSEWGWRTHPDANFYLLPTRGWELLAGSVAALVFRRFGAKPNSALSFLGIFLIVASIVVFDESTPSPSAYMLAPVGGTILVLMFYPRGAMSSGLGALLELGAVRHLGLISYSAYLIHQPLLAFYRWVTGLNISTVEALLLIVVTFLLAHFSWKYVESPYRTKKT